ncbi:small integral membrane protein 4 [Cimex lectularius]|uniref:Small integral membrane protein 4 n=1 Tax=Cimex lectularius TaxID=79782 RepID=A0A8I6SGN9_CIMLE|nr:small integral membrane protein 4 [Cimex lectularius]
MRSSWLARFLDKWPGKKIFGIYRFMPIFFLMGAALEFSMINWDFQGKVNFYRTYKRRQAQAVADRILLKEEEKEEMKA